MMLSVCQHPKGLLWCAEWEAGLASRNSTTIIREMITTIFLTGEMTVRYTTCVYVCERKKEKHFSLIVLLFTVNCMFFFIVFQNLNKVKSVLL